jgi:hypothetical protein
MSSIFYRPPMRWLGCKGSCGVPHEPLHFIVSSYSGYTLYILNDLIWSTGEQQFFYLLFHRHALGRKGSNLTPREDYQEPSSSDLSLVMISFFFTKGQVRANHTINTSEQPRLRTGADIKVFLYHSL